MYRTPLLLSLLCACAAAQAQVTLSGTVDVGVGRTTGSLVDKNEVFSGGNSTSKLTFRGHEDLGGGMYGMFWLEAGLNVDTGTGQQSSRNNQPSGATNDDGLKFNRRSIVGLGGNWGVVYLGREWSPTYDTYTARYDPFGVAAGIGLNYTGGLNPQLVRTSNAIAYTTPSFLGGLKTKLQHWRGENDTVGPTANNGTGEGFQIAYDREALSLLTSFARTRFTVGDMIYRNVAGYYDFGTYKVAFNFNHDQQGALRQQGWLLGGWYRVGVGEIKASYSTLDSNGADGKKIAIGYVHNLSKRTAWYATAAHIRNSGGANFALVGSTTGVNQSSSGVGVGIRHHF
jgi:predicted porin